MGKLTLRGPVPKDDPMFSGGPEVFSRIDRTPSTNSPGAAGGGKPPGGPTPQPAAPVQPVTRKPNCLILDIDD